MPARRSSGVSIKRVNFEVLQLPRWVPSNRNWPRLVAGAVVLLAHLLLFDALYVIGYRPAQPQEIFFTLPVWTPPAKPLEKTGPAKPVRRAVRPPPLFQFTPLPSNAITLPDRDRSALQGLGQTLSCSNPDSLSPEERKRCAEKVFKWVPKDDNGMSLVVKAPPPAMTAAERSERIRKTADPCLIAQQSNTHVPECIYKTIYGDKLP
jgi:hypothetical protein